MSDIDFDLTEHGTPPTPAEPNVLDEAKRLKAKMTKGEWKYTEHMSARMVWIWEGEDDPKTIAEVYTNMNDAEAIAALPRIVDELVEYAGKKDKYIDKLLGEIAMYRRQIEASENINADLCKENEHINTMLDASSSLLAEHGIGDIGIRYDELKELRKEVERLELANKTDYANYQAQIAEAVGEWDKLRKELMECHKFIGKENE